MARAHLWTISMLLLIAAGLSAAPARAGGNAGDGGNGGGFDPFRPAAAAAPAPAARTVLGHSQVVVPAAGAKPSTPVVPPKIFISVGDAPDVHQSSTKGGTAVFTVSLSQASKTPVTFSYSTVPGTAEPGEDYTSKHGTATIAPGHTSVTISVAVVPELPEKGEARVENFFLALTSVSGAKVARGQGSAKILNPPAAPITLNIDNSLPVRQSTTQTKTSQFHVTLSSASSKSVTFHFATSNGSARAGTDYVSKSGTLTLKPGQTSVTITVTVLPGKADKSGNLKSFFLNLSQVTNAKAGEARGFALIIPPG